MATALLAVFLPRVYRSAATITVSSPAVSAELLKQAGPLSREERMRAISQQLLSRPVLERVVRDEHLAPDGNVDARVDRLLAARSHQGGAHRAAEAGRRRARAQLDAFLLSYAAATPGEAQRVAEPLARVFVEASSRTREARAEDTSAFIATQLRASKSRLDELEERLRTAKESYMGRLPEQTQSNLSIAAGMRQQLESTANSLRGEQDRLSMIERQIEGMQQGAGDVAMPGRRRVERAGAGRCSCSGSSPTRAACTPRSTPRSSGCRRSSRPRSARPRRSASGRKRIGCAAADRPGYRQLLADREMARLRVRDLQRAESQMRAQVAAYQSRVEAAPMVEQQLASLQREYDLEGSSTATYGEAAGGGARREPRAQPRRRAVPGALRRLRAARARSRPSRCGCCWSAWRSASASAARPRSAASTSIARCTTSAGCRRSSRCRCWRDSAHLPAA